MAAWGGILALSGFQYDAHGGKLAFAPRINAEDFRCFWSTPTGWGTFTQRLQNGKLEAALVVEHGSLALGELKLALPAGMEIGAVQVSLGGAALKARPSLKAGVLSVKLSKVATVEAGQALRVTA